MGISGANMSIKKRIVWMGAALVLALILGVAGYILSGSSAVESWVGSQLLDIGGGYLQPQMHFDRLTYLRPRTIVLDNLTLTSPDPSQPERSVVILAVKRARLELTEIPRRGQPIKFSEVVLESPEVRCIAAGKGGTGLIGFSHLLKSSANSAAPTPATVAASASPVAATTPAATTATAAVATTAASMKLSDWLLIRRLEIKNGKIVCDPRTADTAPFWLDGINAKLDFTPADAAGNYTLATTISRKPAFDLDIEGKINIDTLNADLAKLELTLDLQEKSIHVLPPELQKILQSYEITGQLRATASGNLPFTHWRQSALKATIDLTKVQVAVGQNRLAIDSWNFQADMSGGVASLRKADARLLGGDLHFAGTLPLAGNQPAQLSMRAADLKIQQLLRTVQPDQPPLYAGRFSADVNYTAPLAEWNKQAAGGGNFSIREGRLGNIPILGPILTVLGKSLKKALGVDNHDLKDSADGSLSFAGAGVRIDRLDASSGGMALRATGTIAFDQQLDLRVNAGPLEMLQNSLGGVGQLWASVSDAFAGYRVNGTLASPRVSVEIGGR